MLKKIAATGLLAFAFTGAALAASAPASADVATTSGHGGVLSGNQVIVPVTVCGNSVQAIAVLSDAFAMCGAGGGYKHH